MSDYGSGKWQGYLSRSTISIASWALLASCLSRYLFWGWTCRFLRLAANVCLLYPTPKLWMLEDLLPIPYTPSPRCSSTWVHLHFQILIFRSEQPGNAIWILKICKKHSFSTASRVDYPPTEKAPGDLSSWRGGDDYSPASRTETSNGAVFPPFSIRLHGVMLY
jgi:hypothetical protein